MSLREFEKLRSATRSLCHSQLSLLFSELNCTGSTIQRCEHGISHMKMWTASHIFAHARRGLSYSFITVPKIYSTRRPILTHDEMHGAGNSFKHVPRFFDRVSAESDRQRTQTHRDDGHGARRPSVVYTETAPLLTRRRSESAYICQVHDNVMM